MWINSVFSRFDCGRWMAFFGNHVGATALNSYTQKFVTRIKRLLCECVFTCAMCKLLTVSQIWSMEHIIHRRMPCHDSHIAHTHTTTDKHVPWREKAKAEHRSLTHKIVFIRIECKNTFRIRTNFSFHFIWMKKSANLIWCFSTLSISIQRKFINNPSEHMYVVMLALWNVN